MQYNYRHLEMELNHVQVSCNIIFTFGKFIVCTENIRAIMIEEF